jgi:nucleotide-binding universal stress UspA family protein
MTKRYKTILAATAGEPGSPALEWAASIAGRGDEIRIVTAYDPVPAGSSDWQLERSSQPPQQLVAQVQAEVDAVTRRRADVSVRMEFVARIPSRALPTAAVDADLVVVGTPHRYSSYAALAGLAWHARCPVLVVGDQPPMSLSMAHVTAAIGDDETDDAVMRATFEVATSTGAQVRVLHAWQPEECGDYLAAETAAAKRLDAYVALWSERHPTVGVTIEMRAGTQADVIRRFSGDVSLLVVSGGRPGTVTDASRHLLTPVVDAAIEARRHRPTLIIPGDVTIEDATERGSETADSQPIDALVPVV